MHHCACYSSVCARPEQDILPSGHKPAGSERKSCLQPALMTDPFLRISRTGAAEPWQGGHPTCHQPISPTCFLAAWMHLPAGAHALRLPLHSWAARQQPAGNPCCWLSCNHSAPAARQGPNSVFPLPTFHSPCLASELVTQAHSKGVDAWVGRMQAHTAHGVFLPCCQLADTCDPAVHWTLLPHQGCRGSDARGLEAHLSVEHLWGVPQSVGPASQR